MPSRNNKTLVGSSPIVQTANGASPTFLERTLTTVEDVQREITSFNNRLERMISRAVPREVEGEDGVSGDVAAYIEPPLTVRIDDTLVEVTKQLDLMNRNVATLESII